MWRIKVFIMAIAVNKQHTTVCYINQLLLTSQQTALGFLTIYDYFDVLCYTDWILIILLSMLWCGRLGVRNTSIFLWQPCPKVFLGRLCDTTVGRNAVLMQRPSRTCLNNLQVQADLQGDSLYEAVNPDHCWDSLSQQTSLIQYLHMVQSPGNYCLCLACIGLSAG